MILVIDDNREFAKRLVRELGRRGYEIRMPRPTGRRRLTGAARDVMP